MSESGKVSLPPERIEENQRLTEQQVKSIKALIHQWRPFVSELRDPLELTLQSERAAWSEVDRLSAALEEAQQQIKELQEANRSACESRDIAYRSRNDAIVTSNQHYAQLVEAQSVIQLAQQTIARQREALEWYGFIRNYELGNYPLLEDGNIGDWESFVQQDAGKVARAALEGHKEGETQS